MVDKLSHSQVRVVLLILCSGFYKRCIPSFFILILRQVAQSLHTLEYTTYGYLTSYIYVCACEHLSCTFSMCMHV